MSLGKPVIVSNVGWFSELPDNTCLKVDVDSNQEETLLEFFTLLTEDQEIGSVFGENARKYILSSHDPAMSAKKYYDFIKYVCNGDEILINTISKNLSDLGVNQTDGGIIKSQVNKIITLFDI